MSRGALVAMLVLVTAALGTWYFLDGSSSPLMTAAAVSTTTATPTLPAGSAWLTKVQLGDSKYATLAPKKGYIYICHVATGGQGAKVNGPWIHGSSWTPSEKVAVTGSVSWPNASYSMFVKSAKRSMTSNDLPTDRTTGTFPVASSDPAAQYDQNRSSIVAQKESFSLPATPIALASPDCIYGAVGIMVNGVVLLDGFDALYRDALAHEEQDSNEGHPNNELGYHYHGFEKGFVQEAVSKVVGFAFDGYPITGSKLWTGKYLHTADLDACHGLTSSITLDGKSVTTYHYVLTQDFPYSVSCFHGTSYEPHPGGQGTQQSGQQGSSQNGQAGNPPQEAISACSGKTDGSSCSLLAPQGTMEGVCRTPPGQRSIACVPH